MGRRVGLRAELRPFGGAGGAQRGGYMGGELRSPSAPPFASSNACTRAWLSCSRERHSALGAALPRRARRGSARSALCTGGGSAGCIRCNPPPLLQVHAEGGRSAARGRPAAHLLELHARSRARCTPRVARGAARALPCALRLGRVALSLRAVVHRERRAALSVARRCTARFVVARRCTPPCRLTPPEPH